jgi:hypothetical protein
MAYVVFNKPPHETHRPIHLPEDLTGLEEMIMDKMIQALKGWLVSTMPVDPVHIT